MTHSALLPHHLSSLMWLLLYFCLWLHNDWGRSLETVCLFWCFSVILDLQLPLDSQLHISLCPHNLLCVSFLAQYWSRISSLLAGAPRLNSGNFDRISLPNIEKNGATPVIIWGVDLCAVTSLWRSCRKSFFQQSTVLTFYLPICLGPQRGWGGGVARCSIPFSTRKGLNPSEINWGPLSVLNVWGTPNRAYVGWRLSMTFVLLVDLRITTSKYLLLYYYRKITAFWSA